MPLRLHLGAQPPLTSCQLACICDAPLPRTPLLVWLPCIQIGSSLYSATCGASSTHRSSLYQFNKHLPAVVMCQASCAPTLDSQNPTLHPQEPLDPPEERLYQQGIGIQCDNCVCVVPRAGGGRGGGQPGGGGAGRLHSSGNTMALIQMTDDPDLQ